MPKRRIDVFNPTNYKPLGLCDTIIVGIDPGVTTGISMIGFDSRLGVPVPQAIEHWGSGQISYGGSGNEEDVIDFGEEYAEQQIARKIGESVEALTSAGFRTFVVIEDFIVRQQNSSREFLAPVRLTSGIVQEVYDLCNLKVVYQTPADAKGVCTNERMDKWGYEIETQKDRHSRDADRHSILFLRRLMEKPSRMRV